LIIGFDFLPNVPEYPLFRCHSLTGPAINGSDEQNVSQPLRGVAVANQMLIVPAGTNLSAYVIAATFRPIAPRR
jgi:hypothetical protein